MFDTLKTEIYSSKKTVETPKNIFEKEMFKQEHEILSENGALKYDTTGNPLLDDFAKLGMFKSPRPIKDIFNTMETLYNYNPLLSVKEMCYLRLITRDTKYLQDIFKAQRGQGLRFEFLGRSLWLAINHQNTFRKNLLIFISIGSWMDFFDLLELDLSYIHNGRNHALNWDWMLGFLSYNLQDPEQSELIKKYLPQIKNSKRCTTLHSQCTNYIAKKIAIYLFGDEDKANSYAKYRHLKASGTAHQWQQAISRKDFKNLNFNAIAGRALNKLVNSKFLENHGLEEEFEKWMESQPIAKFKGYPYELFKNVHPGYHDSWGITYKTLKNYQIATINKQFMGLIETAKQGINQDSKFIVALDTSGSMTCEATGTGVSAAIVGKAMGVYFSYLLNGPFANTFLEFEDTCTIHKFNGDTPIKKFQTPCGSNWGSTEFLSVAKLFVTLKNKGYKEEDFPTGVICVSDGELNRSCRYNQTNFETFRHILKEGGFSDEYVKNFKLILWDIARGQSPKFESMKDTENVFYIGGLDPSAIAFILGVETKDKVIITPKTPEELFETAMSQEILNLIKL